jgi:hypothetical protein
VIAPNRYLGSALAALDDDGRLHFPDAEGDSLAADAARLASKLPEELSPLTVATSVLYNGPYRMLVLTDGALVRRGRWTRLPVDRARALEKSDGALVDPNYPADRAAPPESFPKLHRELGSDFLLKREIRAPDLEALADVTAPMQHRLEALIRRGDEYFVMTGSDPSQAGGCCPSNEVGEANRLAGAGILESHAASAEGACPTLFYAFAGEIHVRGGRPAFVRNEELRSAVRARLAGGNNRLRRLVLTIALLAVLALGLAAAIGSLLRR